MRRLVLGLLLLAAAGVVTWAWLHGAQAPAPTSQTAGTGAAVPVVTAPVQQRDVPLILTGIGTVQAFNAASIRSQVTGVVQSVDFREGQTVRKGDRLAQIDPRPYAARLEQAEAQLERDKAQLANVEVNLNRNIPLLSRGYATEQLVADQRAQVAQLQATVKFDQGAVDDARTQLSYTTLTAPFDGVTGIRLLDVGNVIQPTDVNGLVVLTQVKPISVVFTLPSANIAQVQDALTRGAVTAVAYDQSGSTALDTGSLLLINNQANPNSGTVQLKATFPNELGRLWPGAFVNVELTTSVAKGAATVPTDAIQQSDKGPFVFVVGADDKVRVRPVEVGQRTRGTAVVSTGLSPGETVVAQGQYRVTDGAVVQPADPSQVAASSTASAGMLP